MLRMTFRPFRPVVAVRDVASDLRFLHDVAHSAHRAFRAGSEGSHGGSMYRRRGGAMRAASAPGDWPAVQSGRHIASIRTVVTMHDATIGTGAYSDKGFPYSLALRTGTRKMARRKASDDAIKAGVAAALPRKSRFARFRVV